MKITLQYKYLKHDIDQRTYRMANMRIEDAMRAGEASADQNDSDVTYYRRLIEYGVAQLKARLNERIVKVSTDANDTLDTTKASWIIEIKDDGLYNYDSKSIAEMFHQFVVLRALTIWANDYSPTDIATLAQESASLAEDIINTIYTIELPTKHRREIYHDVEEITIG